MKQEMLICHQISEIKAARGRVPASITITFKFPSYLKDVEKRANEFVEKLMKQTVFGGDPEIRGLRLAWTEGDDEEEIKKDAG